MADLFQIFGLAGAVLVRIAYLPQILHLAKERCSAGISIRAWLVWLLAATLILSHAVYVHDIVFMALQAVNIAAIASVIFPARRYKSDVCESHKSK